MWKRIGVVEDFTLGVRNENGAVEVLGFCMWKRIGAVEDSGLRTWSEIDVAGAHQPISTKPRLPRVFTMQKGFIMA